jgi:tryptophanyl-tRNA synthetase
MEKQRKRVFSGIQPTGNAHIGNYFGALRHWVRRQEEYEAFYCIVDLHALTLPWDPAELRDQSLRKAAELLACGLDPERNVLFFQSHVPAHAELAWVLICIARMGELRRMVQFKERSKGAAETVGAGLFTYPVLQAADVLLYRAHGVPVGEDQRQHIELMRDLAVRFNNAFGDTFVVPEAWIPEVGAKIMSLDDPTRKMSKSDMDVRPGSGINLIDDPETITKKIRSAVTDSGRDVRAGDDKPALSNLLAIYSLVDGASVTELEARFEGKGYGDFKAALAEALSAHLAPIRQRYEELVGDLEELSRYLKMGANRASEVAESTLADVRKAIGLVASP